ncbi:MAG: cysteine-rich CWC family protein [Gammaproteobacteria bacterium]|nr:cysteine-rich CWC family protein [Gammaproteobacteria bacterium]
MNTETDEMKCPLCGNDNACLNAKCGGESENTCWCNSNRFTFPEALLAQIPERLRHKACICQACVEAYHADN